MNRYAGALDQETTSTRFMIFDRGGATIASASIETRQICPQPGWWSRTITAKGRH